MSTILVSGSLAYDHIMDFEGLFKDHFLPERLHNINLSFNVPGYTEHFGGTAGNVAYGLALLGEYPILLATVGKDFGRYKEHLEAVGIEIGEIIIDPEKVTSFAYIMTDEGDNQIAAFHHGAGATPYARPVPASPDAIAIISAGCIDDIMHLPDVFRGHGTRFLFDPGQSIIALTADDLRNGMTDADTVFANDYEFALITERTGWREADVLKVAKNLVITLGDQGSRVITRESETRVPAVTTRNMADPTGAGDAYRAGFIKGMCRGKDVIECARLGSVVAVYCVENVGTQTYSFTPDELSTRYEATFGVPLVL